MPLWFWMVQGGTRVGYSSSMISLSIDEVCSVGRTEFDFIEVSWMGVFQKMLHALAFSSNEDMPVEAQKTSPGWTRL